MEGKSLKKKIRNSIVAIILFILTIGIVLGAGNYKNSVSAEKVQFQAEISGKNNAPIVLDLAQQSWPKQLVQPGLVQIFTGHGPMGIKNSSNQALLVQVVLKEFPGKVELVLPEVNYDEETFALTKVLKPGQLFKMELTVEVPKEYRKRLVGFSGEIQFINQKDKTLLSSIPVHIVNSKYGDPYKKLKIQRSSTSGSWGEKPSGSGKPDSNGKPKGSEKEKCH